MSENMEKEIEKDMATIETIKAQIVNLNKQFETLQISIQEIEKAVETLKHYEKMKDEEILIPIGGGTFISAKINDKKGFITIGSSLYTQLPIQEMIKKLEARKKDMEDMSSKVSNDLYQLQQNYAILDAKIEDEYRKYLEERRNVQSP